MAVAAGITGSQQQISTENSNDEKTEMTNINGKNR